MRAKAFALLGVLCAPQAGAQTWPLLGTTPMWRIDGEREDIEGRVVRQVVMVWRDFRLAVFSEFDWQFIVFDSAGRRTGKFGGKGGGPGEFDEDAARTQTDLKGGFIGDSIWIPDESASRITVFGPGTKLVRTVPMPRFDPKQLMSFTPLAFLERGRLLGSAAFPDAPDGSLIVVGPTGTVERRLLDLPVDSSVVRGEGGFGRVPVRGRPIHVVSPDGTRIALVTYSAVDAGKGMFRIVMLRSTGDTIYSRSYPFTGRTITAAMAQDSARAMVFRKTTGGRVPSVPASILSEARKRIPAVSKPFGSTAVLGHDGSLWIARDQSGNRPPYPPRRWLGFDERGQLLGEVETHYQGTIVGASQHSIVTVHTDSLGFAQLVRYRIERAR